jgi:hypothetical protein
MIPVAEKRTAFRKLHEIGCFLLSNPWDVAGTPGKETQRRLPHVPELCIESITAGT